MLERMWNEPQIIGRHGKVAPGVTTTLALFVLLAIAGCAAPDRGGVASPVMTGQPVAFDLIFVTTSSSVADLEAEKQSLGDAIISGLNDSKMFARVTGNPADIGAGNGIKISGEIKGIKKVSPRAREWTGALAGRARMLVRVTISDLASGNPIEQFDAVGQSGKSAFAGTTEEAIQRAAEQIVAAVRKLNAQMAQ